MIDTLLHVALYVYCFDIADLLLFSSCLLP